MHYGPFSNHALDDFCRPAAFVSSVIFCFLFLASPAQANYIYDSATGSWIPTSRTVLAPPSAGSPFNYVPRDTPPTVSSTGAFQNKTGGTFGSPPVGGASRTVPVTVNGTTTKPNVNRALLSRLGKGGLAGIALGAGIDALLDGIGAIIDEAGNLNIPNNDPIGSVPPPSNFVTSYQAPSHYSANLTACKTQFQNTQLLACFALGANSSGSMTYRVYECANSRYDLNLTGTLAPRYNLDSGICYYGGSAPPVKPPLVPLPPGMLSDAIDSSYFPHPSDYPTISAEPAMIPTIVEVEPISRLTIPPTTTTIVDLDTGEITVVETNIWQDFNIKDNNTAQPKIETETTTKTETYVDGEKTSETTITNNTGTTYSEGATDTQGNQLNIPPPIDCDLFPTACAWFDWTQDEPIEPGDDLSPLLQEVPIVSETYNITGGVAACPAPMVLDLSVFGSREVSYQPLCDLASTMKFLYLALMSFAAAVLLHRSINRV